MILIVDNRISEECERSLLKEGHLLIKLPKDPSLSNAICSHPDTLLFYSNGRIITTADYCDAAAYVFSDIRELAPEVKITFTSDIRKNCYPDDCIMNALVAGGCLFCKEDTVSATIKEYATEAGLKIVNTKQGYPACSVLHFGDSAITSDNGLANLMSKNGINVTLIRPGYISLPPYDYGFIGGASGVVGKKVYFFGDISNHPDCEKICDAINSAGYTVVSLSKGDLADLGGIIAL